MSGDYEVTIGIPVYNIERYIHLAMAAIEQKKRRTSLRQKSYYARRCSVLMMYDYHFACTILANNSQITPPFTNREVRDMMRHPMTFWEIVRSRQSLLNNLGSWLLGVLPPSLTVWLLKRKL